MTQDESEKGYLVCLNVSFIRLLEGLKLKPRILYANALDDFLLELGAIEQRVVPKIDRDWLKRFVQENNIKQTSESPLSEECLPLLVSIKHVNKLEELSDAIGEAVSYFFKVAVEEFLFSLGLIDKESLDKVDKEKLKEVFREEKPRIDTNPPGDTSPSISVTELSDNN